MCFKIFKMELEDQFVRAKVVESSRELELLTLETQLGRFLIQLRKIRYYASSPNLLLVPGIVFILLIFLLYQ